MVVIGDLHLKSDEVYKKAQYKFLNWVNDEYFKEDILFLGDVFDSSAPNWQTYSFFKDFLKGRNSRVYIVQGNHDVSKLRGSALQGLHLMDNVKVFFDKEEYTFDFGKCLILPHKLSSYKEEYESLKGDYKFIFTHITPPQEAFGDEGVQLSLNGEYIHGHTHMFNTYKDHITGQFHNILGVPYPTRNGENQHHKIIVIDGEGKYGFLSVPEFLKIETIEYGVIPENKDWLYNIINAPDYDSVFEMYKDFYIRDMGVQIKRDEKVSLEQIEFSAKSLKQKFVDWAKDKGLEKDLFNFCLAGIDRIESE